MEDIRSQFDKILYKFNDSITHTAPKKLDFDNSDIQSPSLKRRFTQTLNDSQLNGLQSTPNLSHVSNNSSSSRDPSSPWEIRRLKADLIEARSRITYLKQEADHRYKIHTEKEMISESRIDELKKQSDFSSNKILDLEKQMTVLRQREQAAKREVVKLQRELAQSKQQTDDLVHKLRMEKAEIEETARHVENLQANELGELRRHSEKIEMELDLLTEELKITQTHLNEQKTRVGAFDALKIQYEKQQNELDFANSRIKDLEFEIASYADWKEVTKTNQARLISLPELDKELERLKAKNKDLHDLLGNKLLMEEQVHDLKKRLEKEEGARAELVATQVKLSYAEQELQEWIKIAQDHCPPNTLVCPIALRTQIENLLKQDIISASEMGTNKSQYKNMSMELLDYKKKCDVYAKNIDELNVALKRHKIFKERLQKKLRCVSNERDCFKQLYDNFEKDMTLSNTNVTEASSNEAQLRMRLDMLEKALVGYKEMCANLEKLNSTTDVDAGVSNEHVKQELDTLRIENEHLRRRKEQLELELEHRYLKGDFNMMEQKVVRLKNSPSDQAYENSKNMIEKLQAEIERLRRKVKQLEDDNETTQTRLNETTNMTMNIKEVNQLKAELESAESRLKVVKERYKSASMEYREVCYMLFGYRLDRVGSNMFYKVSSMYAESEDDFLSFRLNESNMLVMLETPYSETVKPIMESHLIGEKSLPIFLSTLTLELFQRSTITIS